MIQKACLGIQRIKVFLQEVITSTGKSCHVETLKGIFKRHRLGGPHRYGSAIERA
ncbi:hypothetical protein [Chondrinema litorale]|uniref:hypothetical protein n=1 Tax=Chondrinema litorale TaxID=2994555 RepID=UPI002542C8F3|nr:hypothetical protein [Chondrinema litorale]UZR96812.1 hypothetical protein OQ292_24250 [Chondrinema litorale]